VRGIDTMSAMVEKNDRADDGNERLEAVRRCETAEHGSLSKNYRQIRGKLAALNSVLRDSCAFLCQGASNVGSFIVYMINPLRHSTRQRQRGLSALLETTRSRSLFFELLFGKVDPVKRNFEDR